MIDKMIRWGSDKVIVCVGSLDSGHTFLGPFDNANAAERWLEMVSLKTGGTSQYDAVNHVIVPLETPVKLCEC